MEASPGWIVLNRKAVRIADVPGDPRFFDNVDRVTGRPTRSLLGIPLITKNKVVGVLETLNKQRGKFTEGDESVLLVLGAQAAVAIENARLFQQSDLISEFVHELRTPLASLSTATYLLLQPELAREQREQIIHNIHNETLRLNSMAASFLDLARLESGRVQFRKTAFNVAELLVRVQGHPERQGAGGERRAAHRGRGGPAAVGSGPRQAEAGGAEPDQQRHQVQPPGRQRGDHRAGRGEQHLHQREG